MSPKPHLPLKLARRVSLHAQLLNANDSLSGDKEGVVQVIARLGYVQIDTIAVIERAHHHTLWTRLPAYSANMLHELQAQDRRIFEYWGHALSYLPMSDYRFYRRQMLAFADPYSKWERERLEKYGHLMSPLLERIRQEGSLSTEELAPHPGEKPPAWGDMSPNPAKAALDMLFFRGEIMVSERRNFQRVYDLAERVLPAGLDTRLPEEKELGCFLVHRALSAYGIAQKKEIQDHIFAADKAVVARALAELVRDGRVAALEVEGLPGVYYAFPETLNQAADLPEPPSKAVILSPFDNLIIQRERIKKLFNFDYALECYTPPAKRKYGHFILPVLWQEGLVARLDAKAERKNKTLVIRKLWLEDGFMGGDEFFAELKQALQAFARFNNCENVVFESPDGESNDETAA